MTQYSLCLDVGGTFIKGATFPKVSGQDHYAIQYFDAKSDQDATTIMTNFQQLLLELANSIDDPDASIVEVAMAFPGPFDYKNGIPLLEGLNKYGSLYQQPFGRNLAFMMTEDLRFSETRYRFVNDAVAFAVGEHSLSQKKTGAYFTIGTGFGSTFISINEIVKGKYGIPDSGMVYALPMKDSILDDYLSARGIERLANQYFIEPLSVKELSNQARAGVKDAQAVFEEFGTLLWDGIGSIVNEFRPQVICFGGQISKSADLFLDQVKHNAPEETEINVSNDTSYSVLKGLSTLGQYKEGENQ